MEKRLIFKDRTLERDFNTTRQSFHVFSFRILLFSLVSKSSLIFFANPLEQQTLAEPILIVPFIFAMAGITILYFVITKKLARFCHLALLTCVVFIILIGSEYLNRLQMDKVFEPWIFFLLGVNLEFLCSILLLSRIRWTYCLLMITLIHFYGWIRILDIFNKNEGQYLVILLQALHIFLHFTINYYSEKGDRSTFEKQKRENSNMKEFETLVKNVIPTALIILREGEIDFLNKAAEDLFGISCGEKIELADILGRIKIGRNDHERSTSEINSKKNAANHHSIYSLFDLTSSFLATSINNEKAESISFEAELEDKALGHQKSVSCQLLPLLWKDSSSLLIILSDISTLKNIYRKNLDNCKDNLLATVSHDLKTPLNGMLGMLELLLEESLLDSQKEKLHIIMSSGKLLLNMINDILDFSLVSMGKLRLKFESTNVSTLLDETVKILILQAKIKGLDLEVRNTLKSGNDHFLIDANRLKQVLLNLIGNAIKYTTTGKIQVIIREEEIDDSEELCLSENILTEQFCIGDIIQKSIQIRNKSKCLLFEVEDTGIGLKPGSLSKLFKLSEDCATGGIGLGLAISQSLVCLMNSNKKGAEIKVESEYGKGSKFSFPIHVKSEPNTYFQETLPIASRLKNFEVKCFFSQSKDLSPTSNLVYESDLLLKFSKRQINVLVVDDDPINILVAESYLLSYKNEFSVCTATNGKEAIEKLLHSAKKNIYFDIILMDCNMPIMDGYEATQKLKSMMSSGIFPYTPIVASTANVDNRDKDRCLLTGMDYFLPKPYSKQQLMNLLKEVIKPYL